MTSVPKPAMMTQETMTEPMGDLADDLCELRPHRLPDRFELTHEVNQVIDGDVVCQVSVPREESLLEMVRLLERPGCCGTELLRPRIAVFLDSGEKLSSDDDEDDDSRKDDDDKKKDDDSQKGDDSQQGSRDTSGNSDSSDVSSSHWNQRMQSPAASSVRDV